MSTIGGHPMISASGSCDVVILGSGIAGLSAALAAHALGLEPVVLEKAARIGGGTVHSYGLIWVGQNHLAKAAGQADTRDEVLAYMRFLGGGNIDEARLSAFVDRSPEALKFFEKCGVRFRVVGGVTDHYHDKAPGSRAVGRCIETAAPPPPMIAEAPNPTSDPSAAAAMPPPNSTSATWLMRKAP